MVAQHWQKKQPGYEQKNNFINFESTILHSILTEVIPDNNSLCKVDSSQIDLLAVLDSHDTRGGSLDFIPSWLDIVGGSGRRLRDP